jgi:SH3-like domain-containing protein
MVAMPKLTLAVLVLCVSARNVPAQAGVMKQAANLRTGPDTAHAIIRQLHANDAVAVLDSNQTTGYYSVRTAAGEEGWVYGAYVKLLPGGTAPPSAPAVVYRDCPPEGSATQEYRRAANRLKDRVTRPRASEIDPAVTLAAMLARGADETRWQSTQGAAITGIVVDVKRGSQETVNCGATDKQFQDTHIAVALHAGDPDTSWVIVEVTPRWRAYLAAQGTAWWATDSLRARLKGHSVTFTGWMFFDGEHQDEAENTKPKAPRNWRGTAWEVHPVTGIVVHP